MYRGRRLITQAPMPKIIEKVLHDNIAITQHHVYDYACRAPSWYVYLTMYLDFESGVHVHPNITNCCI
jgi:hypothetical protein